MATRVRLNNPDKNNIKTQPYVCVYIDTEVDRLLLVMQESLNTEVSRAMHEEQVLGERILEEIARAEGAEHDITVDLKAESDRAVAAETDLMDKILREEAARITEDVSLTRQIDAEATRATAKENEIERLLQAEVSRSVNKDNVHTNDIRMETERAGTAEDILRSDLATEHDRALAKERALDQQLIIERERAIEVETNIHGLVTEETRRARSVETDLHNALGEEIIRAEGIEAGLTLAIDKERIRASSAEGDITSKINAEVLRSTQADAQLNTRVTTLENLGHWVGSFATYEALIAAGLPSGASVNDYVTVRADETHLDAHNVPMVTRYILTSVNPIVWTFDIVINEDISGKLDKPQGIVDYIMLYDGEGGVKQGPAIITIATKIDVQAEETARTNEDTALRQAITEHNSNMIKHITGVERTTWNAKLDQAIYEAHINSTVHITNAERIKWNKVISDLVLTREDISDIQQEQIVQNTDIGKLVAQDLIHGSRIDEAINRIVLLEKAGGRYLGIHGNNLPVLNIASANQNDWFILQSADGKADYIQHVNVNAQGVRSVVNDYQLMSLEYTEYLFQLWLEEHAKEGHNIDYTTAPIETVEMSKPSAYDGNIYFEVCGNMVQMYFDRFTTNRDLAGNNRWTHTELVVPARFRRNNTLEQVTYGTLVPQDDGRQHYNLKVRINHADGEVAISGEYSDMFRANRTCGGSLVWFIGDRA